ncbi:MAG: hypothetical protein C4290_01685 [Chloroflexota bacterium]
MRFSRGLCLATAVVSLTLLACGSEATDGRTIRIVQSDDACTPDTITVQAGEKITFELVNQGTKDKEFEGVEGTKFEEVKVPAGKTRRSGWTAPRSPGTAKFKCYLPGGSTTIITAEVR